MWAASKARAWLLRRASVDPAELLDHTSYPLGSSSNEFAGVVTIFWKERHEGAERPELSTGSSH